ncbi:hypothetical protein E1293_22965 [Actinomadura darangshiensis]|uniref:Uncharacterized protein n=1 Tax=Actinomadura darangshiensis TaxID=705336 RepID=A0A4R5B4X3_9ACTN|nr:hypothetical protein [Actinomadura darangshiensis]TDD79610.1 hypothetical protein E1293_22965 [Actinomadura darangshiensis]
MTGYGLRTTAAGRSRPSGMLPSCLVALGFLALQMAGIRWGLGIPGLGEIRAVNDGVIAATAPLALEAILLSAALSAWIATKTDDRLTGVLTDASQQALVASLLFCLTMLPLLSGRSLIGAPRSANLLLLVVAAELAVAAGCYAGYVTLRRPEANALLVCATVSALLSLLGRTILSRALFSDMAVTSSYIGLDDAGHKVGELLTWTPRVQAIAIALATIATAATCLPDRRRPLWLAAAAAAPIALTAITLPLALLGAGTAAAADYKAAFWLHSLGGALTGYLLALPFAIRSGRR